MQSPRSELHSRIAYYKRHKDFNPNLVSKVLSQSKENGFEYVIANISDEARELYSKSRDVGCESHRAKSFIRFKEDGDVLVAKAEFENDIVDLVIDHFMLRFPRKKIVILTDGKAYVGERRLITLEDASKYASEAASQSRLAQQMESDWETFYDSQYIDARRNRKLAMRHIPKKLWKQFGIAEGAKIDKGIGALSLMDFC